jgi:hypothetical protein
MTCFDLLLLSEAFGVPELKARCDSFHVSDPVISQCDKSDQQFEAVSDRIGRREERFASVTTDNKNLTREIKKLQTRVDSIEKSITVLEKDMTATKEKLSHIVTLEFPLENGKPLEGIISYLTQKHGGNVHDKGIVTTTSKSMCYNKPNWSARNLTELKSSSVFMSAHEPGEWVCWDFHELQVRPTHYTINCYDLKSWVVESSLDR